MFTKKYLQDRPILFLNMLIASITALTVVSSFVIIDTSKPVVIIRNRLSEGQIGYVKADSFLELYTFAVAALLFAGVAIFLSPKLYKQKRFMSLMLLALTTIVLIFNFVVSLAIFDKQ